MKEKIERINKLNASIRELNSFLELLQESNRPSNYRKGDFNHFLKLKVYSRIWTGDDWGDHCGEITDESVIINLSETMKVIVSNKIEQYKLELETLIK